MAPNDERNVPRAPFLRDRLGQVFSPGGRLDAGRCCAANAFLGVVVLGGALALRLSGPPDPLGGGRFAFAVAGGAVLLAALVVPLVRPRFVPALLAAHGAIVVALAIAFALACAAWALEAPAERSFRYLPGLIVVGVAYGAALWADFGPGLAHPRRWRCAGFVAGAVVEAVVAALVARAVMRG